MSLKPSAKIIPKHMTRLNLLSFADGLVRVWKVHYKSPTFVDNCVT